MGGWWLPFGLFAALGILWAIATPVFAAPDEASHVIRAASVARGDLLGDKVAGLGSYDRVVTVPGHLVKPGANPFYADPTLYVPCFAFRPELSASCFGALPSDSASVRAPTDVALDPPAFYAVVGLPSLVKTSAAGVYLMRFVSALICAALLASAFLSLRSVAPAWLAASGLAFALTPTTLFLSGTVNPNGVEIAAAVGAWASGAILAHDARMHVDRVVVRRAAIAMIVLVVARGLSPLWLGLIGVTCVALASRAGARALVRSRSVRRWSLGLVAAIAAAVAWLLVARPLGNLYPHGPTPGPVSDWTLFQRSFGGSNTQYKMMIGVVGWLDTPAPELTYVLWTVCVGALIVLALAFASRRHAAVVLGLVVLTLLVPVAIDVSQARKIGLGWQGRWTLPLAVGVPIVAALAVAWSTGGRVVERSRLPIVFGACFVVAQFLLFAQALRRYSVGADGAVDFWRDPAWTPPLPGWFLLIAFLAVLVFVAALIWRPTPVAQQPSAPDTQTGWDQPMRLRRRSTPGSMPGNVDWRTTPLSATNASTSCSTSSQFVARGSPRWVL